MSKLRKAIDMVQSDLDAWGGATFANSSKLIKEVENYLSESVHVLEALDEYLNDYSDADFDQDGYIPNTEMQHKVRIEELLKLA